MTPRTILITGANGAGLRAGHGHLFRHRPSGGEGGGGFCFLKLRQKRLY